MPGSFGTLAAAPAIAFAAVHEFEPVQRAVGVVAIGRNDTFVPGGRYAAFTRVLLGCPSVRTICPT
jgi:hypothetical protein